MGRDPPVCGVPDEVASARQCGVRGVRYRSSGHRAFGGLPIWEQTEAEITPMQGFKELPSPDETA
jgi:hypothetical protein